LGGGGGGGGDLACLAFIYSPYWQKEWGETLSAALVGCCASA